MYGLAHLAAALARVDGILALHGRLEAWRLHDFLMCAEECRSGVVGGAVLRSSGASRRASHGHPEAGGSRVEEKCGVACWRCWCSGRRHLVGNRAECLSSRALRDGMDQSDVADRRSGAGRCCPELTEVEKEPCPGQV